jgi:hypothetical protein
MMLELDHALDQIRRGQFNQGIEKWERCFHEGRYKLSLTDALFLKADLAAVLVESGLVENAKQFDQQILDELSEDEDNECPLVSPEDRTKLDEDIQRRYAGEVGSSALADLGSSSDDGENISAPVAECSTQVTSASSPSLLQSHSSNTAFVGSIKYKNGTTRSASTGVHVDNQIYIQPHVSNAATAGGTMYNSPSSAQASLHGSTYTEKSRPSNVTSAMMHNVGRILQPFRDKDGEVGVQTATDEAEARKRVATSDEAHLESRPTLPEEGIPGPAQQAAEDSWQSQASPTGRTEQGNGLSSPDQIAHFLASNTTVCQTTR